MAFKEIISKVGRREESFVEGIRASFTKRGTKYCLSLRIDPAIAMKMNLSGGDRIRFFVNEQNPRSWLIKKSDNMEQGFKLSRTKNNFLKSSFTWNIYEPAREDMFCRPLDYRIDENGLNVVFK